ncbi:MAG TPA: hypothetical protein VF516_21410, partial [Kofleriaceae bacterium]
GAADAAVTPGPTKDPHDHDAEVAASVFADSFESGHMHPPASTPAVEPSAEAPAASSAPAAPEAKVTLPPTAGEPGEATASHADADLAALVKPAPNTIARGATTSTSAGTAPAAEKPPEPDHG